jgi:hypothetical protein
MFNFNFNADYAFNNQNQMLTQMLDTSVHAVYPYEIEHQNLARLDEDYLVYSKMVDVVDDEIRAAHIEWDFKADKDGHFYAFFPADTVGNYTIYVKIHEERQDEFDEYGELIIHEDIYTEVADVFTEDINFHYLGHFNDEEKFTVRLSFTENRIFFRDEVFMRADSQAVEAMLAPDEEGYINHDSILDYAVSNEREQHFKQISNETDGQRKMNAMLSDGDTAIFVRTNQGEAFIRYEIHTAQSGEYFVYFPGGTDKMFNLSVNGVHIEQYEQVDNEQAYFLGYFEEQSVINMTMTATGDEILFQEALFARADRDNMLEFGGEAADRYFERILSYLKTIEDDGNRHLIRMEAPAPSLNNVRTAEASNNHTSYTLSQGEGTIVYTLTADADGEYFAYFPTAYGRHYTLDVNGERANSVFMREGFSPQSQNAFNLGRFSAGEVFTVTLTLTGESTYYREPVFARARFNFEERGTLRNMSRAISVMRGSSNAFDYFRPVTPYNKLTESLSFTDGREGGYMGYLRTGEGGNAHIEYFFTAEKSGDFYMYFPSRHERKCNLWLLIEGGEPIFRGQVYETDHHHIHYIGYIERGTNFKVTLSLQPGINDVFFREESFMWLDRDLLEADVANLHKMNENSEFRAVSSRHLRVTTNHNEERMLFTSIPSEPGWRVTVNGRRVEIEEFAGGLIAIRVPAGENRIDMKFFPNYMPLGLILMFLGIAGYIGLNIFMGKYAAREKAILERQAGSKSRSKKRRGVRLVNQVRDEYDGYDPDYVNIDPIDDDYEFDTDVKDDDKDDTDN